MRSFFANRLGSIVLAVSVATGAVAAEAEYDSFGARAITLGTEAEMPRYGFTGREHDVESGLIYYRARHYDPAIGQFIQRDPIGFAAGDLNLYAYVGNDPYNFTDPSGLTSSSETAALGASTGGMFAGFISAARNFAWSMLGALALNSDASPDDTPDDTPDNPPIPDTSDPPPPCDPLDPNCVDDVCPAPNSSSSAGPSGWEKWKRPALELMQAFAMAVGLGEEVVLDFRPVCSLVKMDQGFI